MENYLLTIMTASDDASVADAPFVPNGKDRIELFNYTFSAQRMGTASISATLNYPICLDKLWTGREYVQWKDGSKFFLLNTPSSEKGNNDARYIHTLEFQCERDLLLNGVYFVDAVLPGASSADAHLSNSTDVKFFGTLADFVRRVNDVIDCRGFSGDYHVTIEDNVETEGKFVSFEDKSIFEALQDAYELWNVPFYFVGNGCVFGNGDTDIPEVHFEYGRDNQLIDIKKSNTNAEVVTRCTGRGSDENIPYYYPNPTAKGFLGVTTSGSITPQDVQIRSQETFAEHLDLGATLTYSPRNGSTAISNVSLEKKGYGGILSFDISRNDDFTDDIRLVQTEVILRLKNIKPKAYHGNPKMQVANICLADEYLQSHPVNNPYCHEFRCGIDALPLKKGVVYITDINAYTDDYLSENNDGGVTRFEATGEENHGDIQRSFKAETTIVPIDADVVKGFWKGIDDYIKVKNGSVIDYSDFPIVLNIFLSQGETKHINVSFKVRNVPAYYIDYKQAISGFWRISTLGTFTLDIDVPSIIEHSASIPEYAQDTICWRDENGRMIDIGDVGLSLSKSPSEGDTITQVSLWKMPYSDRLMPSVYRETMGDERFYPAVNAPYDVVFADETHHTFGAYVIPGSSPEENYAFTNIFIPEKPKEYIQDFEDIKPSIKGMTNAAGERIDVVDAVYYEDGYDPAITEQEGEDNYRKYPYFFVKLKPTNGDYGFNIFDCAVDKSEMRLSMTSGGCGSCEFAIAAIETADGRFLNPVRVTSQGALMLDDDNRVLLATNQSDIDANQQNSENGIWIALKVDATTYGGDEVIDGLRPSASINCRVNAGDEFVILGIAMPYSYIFAAEKRLEEAIIDFMWKNNAEKFSWSIQFSRIWLANNPLIRDTLSEHSALILKYDNEIISPLYVESYTYKSSSEPLPEISVELGEIIEVKTSGTQRKIDAVKAEIRGAISVGNLLKIMGQTFLRKDTPDTASEIVTFAKGLQVGEYNKGTKGGAFSVDAAGNSTAEVDFLNVRKKATFTEIEVQKLKQAGGQIAISCASGTISRVLATKNGYRCYFEAASGDKTAIFNNEFAVGDLVRCQAFGARPRYWWRRVMAVGADWIDLGEGTQEIMTTENVDDGNGGTITQTNTKSVLCSDANSDAPEAGDVAVQFGNDTDADRQSVQLLSCYGDDAPSYRIFNGINSFSLDGKDIAGIAYDAQQKEPRAYVYGDMRIGDRNNGAGSQYLEYHRTKDANGNVSGKLKLAGVVVQTGDGSDVPVGAFCGQWSSTRTYKRGDIVYDVDAKGSVVSYICISDTPITGNPTSDVSTWQAYAKGSDGKNGKDGINGQNGKDGKNGEKGDDGAYTAFVYCYSVERPLAPAETTPLPSGWYSNIDDIPEALCTISPLSGDWIVGDDGKTFTSNPIDDNGTTIQRISIVTTKDNVSLTLRITASSEHNGDYGYIGNIDSALTKTSYCAKVSTTEVVTRILNIPTAGSHFIEIGYYKNIYVSAYNDNAVVEFINVGVEGYVYKLWMTNAIITNGVAGSWSTPIQVNGQDGKDGVNGQDGKDGATPIVTYSYYYGATAAIDHDAPWQEEAPAVLPGQYLWTRMAVSYSDERATEYSYFAQRIATNGIDGKDGADGQDGQDGVNGPAITFRGNFDATKSYFGTSNRCDVVYYDNQYWIANSTIGGEFAGTNAVPSDGSTYWLPFGASFDSIATGLLFAEDAEVVKLSVPTSNGLGVGLCGGNNYTDENGHKIVFFAGANSWSLNDVRNSTTNICDNGEIRTKSLLIDCGTKGNITINTNAGFYYLKSGNSYVQLGPADAAIDRAPFTISNDAGDISATHPLGYTAIFIENGNLKINNGHIINKLGMIQGMRPYLRYMNSGGTLTTEDHTILIDTESNVDLYLPRYPRIGQEYFVYKMKGACRLKTYCNGKDIFRIVSNSFLHPTDTNPYDESSTKRVFYHWVYDGTQWIMWYQAW